MTREEKIDQAVKKFQDVVKMAYDLWMTETKEASTRYNQALKASSEEYQEILKEAKDDGMFQIFDNNKPADCHHHKVHCTWGNSKFDTFEEAQEYARLWLGEMCDLVPDKPRVKVDYSGYGDFIEIREE